MLAMISSYSIQQVVVLSPARVSGATPVFSCTSAQHCMNSSQFVGASVQPASSRICMFRYSTENAAPWVRPNSFPL